MPCAYATLTREPAAAPPVSRTDVADIGSDGIRCSPFAGASGVRGSMAKASRMKAADSDPVGLAARGSTMTSPKEDLAISGSGSNESLPVSTS
jgi:hypothetical protein